MAKNEDTAAKVTGLRLALDLTQQQVAERARKRASQVSAIENGRCKASTVPCRAWLAKGLGVSLMDLHAYLDGSRSLGRLLAEYTEKKT